MEFDVVTASGDGLSPAILLSIGTRFKAQYLFQIPEGFSRFALEHKIRPGLGFRAAFCTDLATATGLSGLVMRLRGEGHGQFELIGPIGTLKFAQGLRHFVQWRHPAVLVSEFEDDSPDETACCNGKGAIYSDEHIDVSVLKRCTIKNLNNADANVNNNDNANHDQCATAGAPFNPPNVATSRRDGRGCSGDGEAVVVHGRAYTRCHGDLFHNVSIFQRQHTRPGTEMAMQPPSTASHSQPCQSEERSSTIQNPCLGFSIYLKKSNQIVYILNCESRDAIQHVIGALKMVLPPPVGSHIAGCIALTASYLVHELHQSSSLMHYLNSIHNTDVYCVEYHDNGVAATQSYVGHMASARTNARLHLVSKTVFPLPFYMNNNSQRNRNPQDEILIQKLKMIRSLTKLEASPDGCNSLGLRQKVNAVQTTSDSMTTNPLVEGIDVEELHQQLYRADPELKNILNSNIINRVTGTKRKAQGNRPTNNKSAAAALQAHLRGSQTENLQNLAATEKANTDTNQTPEIIFLGTGCAEPSQYRGASAIYLSLAGDKSDLLMDCGEGCWGQLVRLHGYEHARHLVQSRLGIVWISHRHADHMAGILKMLCMKYKNNSDGMTRNPQTNEKLLILGPMSLGLWLSESTPSLGLDQCYTFVHNSALAVGVSLHVDEDIIAYVNQQLRDRLGMERVVTVRVRHCPDSFGIVLTHRKGNWKVVYSGDTQPSATLVGAGMHATLLIHEATFEPALQDEARRKGHSTTTEAIDIANRMRAQCTMLTHFSQRYPKFPEGLPEITVDNRSISSLGVAFDGMRLSFSDFGDVPALTRGVKAVLVAAEKSKALKETGKGTA